MKLELNAKTIAALALPRGKTEDFAWDAELEGFGVRLRRRVDGELRRNWAVQYRANGHTRRMTLGDVNKVTPAQARDAARKLLARVELGHDPQAEKAAKRQQVARTFKAVVDDYLTAREPELRPVSRRINKLYLTGPYFRSLHGLAIDTITRTDVAACILAIARKHSGPTAAAARRALSAFFAWAIAGGLLGDGANPVNGSHRPNDPMPRDNVLSNAELVTIWNAVGSDDDYGRIVRLLILLGARASEIGGMRQSEFDDAERPTTWTLPAERSKNRRAHTIALPAAAAAIIAAVPHTERDHLFGARAGAGFTSWPWRKQELDRRLGEAVKSWRVHDLRRTVATGMADIGIEPHVVEAALNHFSGHRAGVAGVYNRSSYDRAVKAALARWSEHVLALVEGRESNVVALHL
jgi:integrase